MAKQTKPTPPPNPNLPKQADTIKFDAIEHLLISANAEIKKFSNKNPNEIITPIKAASLNRLCEPIKKMLKREPFAEFLDLFDLESLPSYSDTILLLTNYQTAMMQYRAKYFGWIGSGGLEWSTKENPGAPEGQVDTGYKMYYRKKFDL